MIEGHSKRGWGIRAGVGLALLAGSLYLLSAPGPDFTVHDKAYYADANLVDFVRPGLQLDIVSASVGADGTIKARIKFTDPKGLPLDVDGVYTPGALTVRLTAACIPSGQTQYFNYVPRVRPGQITGRPVGQVTSDANRVFVKVSEGVYDYTFSTKAPAGFDKTVTHTIGAFASRDLREFDLGIYTDDTTYNFVPDGSPVKTTRDVVRTVSCNRCHQRLALHGTSGRQSVELCVLCHTPQNTDDASEVTVDFKVMIHKIHRGADLPSVQAGGKYSLGGEDFSTVEFPADVRRCTVCHAQDTGAAQREAYLKPNRASCGACHDDVNFATADNHPTIEISDNQCGNCHFPEGEVEFDYSIKGAHTIPTVAKALPGVVVELLKVDGAAPGQKPTLTFSLRDKAGKPLLPSAMNRLIFRLAGPTNDFSFYPPIQEDARAATGGSDGVYTWTFQNAIPDGAKGSYAIGVEARQLVTLLPGTTKEIPNVRDTAANKVMYFSVDGSPVEPRRKVVALDIPNPGGPLRGCNACHASLSMHGGVRNNPDYCVFCHTPNTAAPEANGGQGVNFCLLVHKIHTGEDLANDYFDFKRVRFPGDRRRCNWCHVDNSQQLPLSTKLLPVQDPKGLLNPVGPTTAACTACHGSIYAASHALANTTRLGESCEVCHGPSGEFSLDRVHAQ